jgi:diguanylate cyclase (GGDEF)-like protein/PAS domain S-box-containing protein
MTFRARAWSRIKDPMGLTVLLIAPVFWVARDLGLIADVPIWFLVGLLVATYLTTSLMTAAMPGAVSGWRLWVRVGVQLGGISLVMYAIGWGPTLAIGLCFGAVDGIRLWGLKVVVPAIVCSSVLLGIGELAIAVGVAPSLVSEPLVHGLAVLAALGVAFTILLFGRATQEKMQAEDELRQSEQRFKALVQHASDIIMVIGADGLIRYVSPAFELVLGYPMETMVGRPGLDFAEPNDVARLRAVLEGASEGRASRAELRMLHLDGRWLWFEVTVTNLFDDPSVEGWVANLRDVTERKQAETALLDAQEAFRHAFDDAPIGMALVGLDGKIMRANRSIGQLFGRSMDELIGVAVRDITHSDDRESSGEQLRRLFDGTIERYYLEKRYVRPDGEVVWAALSASLVRNADHTPAYCIGQLEDITERKALGDRLAHEATHDPMTGLPNRTRFLDRLALALQVSNREHRQVAVLFADLDQFKVINDGLGHAFGDQLLATVADRLRSALRPGDVVARFGGDEFTVLCGEISGEDSALEVASRLAAAIAEPISLGHGEVFITASIGIALSGAPDDTPETLLRDADTAMYRAKADGRANTCVFREDNRAFAVTKLQTGNELHRALERDEFEIHYQPLLELRRDRLVGFEALLRWKHPTRGLLGPGEFIDLAEDAGLIVPIGAWVLETACAQAVQWQQASADAAETDPLVINVNLSPRQLADPTFPGTVAAIVARTGIQASSVCLEITENTLMHRTDSVLAVMHALRRQGLHFSIDDFGTGYSSLAYLRRFPVESLKIDRSFVDGLGQEVGDTSIVEAVVNLAHTLGLSAVAEGVETPEQLRVLRAIGCDQAQGFLLGRPIPPEDVRLTFTEPQDHLLQA